MVGVPFPRMIWDSLVRTDTGARGRRSRKIDEAGVQGDSSFLRERSGVQGAQRRSNSSDHPLRDDAGKESRSRCVTKS